MNTYISPLASLLCLTLCAGWVNAADPVSFDVTLVNETREDLHLTGASWPFGNYEATDYMIPKHHSGTFRVNVWDDRKGRVRFKYSAGEKTCRFVGGLGQKRVGAWLIPQYETYLWSKAVSVGSFHADCQATITKKAQGKNYDLRVTMK